MNPLRPLAHRAVAAAERDLGAPLDYLRHIADTSLVAARVFPTTKRALGYAKACALVSVDYDGQDV